MLALDTQRHRWGGTSTSSGVTRTEVRERQSRRSLSLALSLALYGGWYCREVRRFFRVDCITAEVLGLIYADICDGGGLGGRDLVYIRVDGWAKDEQLGG